MKNQAEKVIVEAIYDAKEGKNQDFKTLQLRVTTKQTNFLNDLLGSDGFEKTKVAFQSVHKDVIASKGIEIGSDLGAKLGRELRIVHIESLEDGPGFRELKNPTNDEPVTSGGAQMYFKRQLGAATEEDVIIARDKAEVSAPVTSEEEAA